jgi:hypothetical protein
MVDIPAEIQTRHVPNENQKRYRLRQPLRSLAIIYFNIL